VLVKVGFWIDQSEFQKGFIASNNGIFHCLVALDPTIKVTYVKILKMHTCDGLGLSSSPLVRAAIK
jgi:hypothetical protein